jgi:hypothetical protein
MRRGRGRATVAAGSLAGSLLLLGTGEATAGDSVKRASADHPFTFTTNSGDVTCRFIASATHSTETDRAGGTATVYGDDPFCGQKDNFYVRVEMTYTNLSGRGSSALAEGYGEARLSLDGVASDVVIRYGTLILRECPPDAACSTANYTLTPK